MKDGMNEEKPSKSDYAWIDAVCDDISAEHNQRVWARGGRCG